MYVGMAALHREFDDLPAARRDLTRSRELGEHAGLPQNAYRWRVVMAQVCEAEGDLEAAIGLLDEAERRVRRRLLSQRPARSRVAGTSVDPSGTGGRRARLGHAGEGLSAADDLSYLREFEHVTLARALVAEHTQEGTRAVSTRRSSSWDACCEQRRTGTGAAP